MNSPIQKDEKMENFSENRIIELVEINFFEELSEEQQQIVLDEMSSDEFNELRSTLFATKPLISIDQFNIEPSAETHRELLQKLRRDAQKGLSRQIMIYGSAIAAVVLLVLFTYTYFFQLQGDINNEARPELVEQEKIKDAPDEIDSNAPHYTAPKDMEPQEVSVSELNASLPKRIVPQNQTIEGGASETNLEGENELEELLTISSENKIGEINQDAYLAYYSDESESDFHYYTRLDQGVE